MWQAGSAQGGRRFNPWLALPVVFGGVVFAAALAGGEEPVRASMASTTAAPSDVAAPETASGTTAVASPPPAPLAAGAEPAPPASAEPPPVAPAVVRGHTPGNNPALLPDLRPFAQTGPAASQSTNDPDLPGAPFFTPDPLNPVWDAFAGPFRENIPDRDQSSDPTPAYTEAEKEQLADEGEKLFFSTTAWGQLPSQGPMVSGDVLSCASCHSGAGFSDNRTHLVGPVREREIGHRQTPSLFGVEHTAPYMWDGRNPTLQSQARGAITSPLEMHATREPTKRELDALVQFQIRRIKTPVARPGVDYDPVKAKRGEVLFRQVRDVMDASGEFPPGQKVACATCHSGEFFTDGKAHRGALPTVFAGDAVIDPGRVGDDGNILGFDTPSLLGLRFTSPYFHDGIAGDPTAPSNLLGGGLGVGALEGDMGAQGPAAARRALRNNVLPFYNSIRFNFGFTEAELDDLAEFLLSL